MIIHNVSRGWRRLIRRLACRWDYVLGKGPVLEGAEKKIPGILIEANWPANPVLRLIKTRAVVLSFVSPFNVRH